jgi:hypothetical protein
VVVLNVADGLHEIQGGAYAVSVYLTNESEAAAYNVRFGVNMGGEVVGWRHDPADDKPSRVNVIRPHSRYPENGAIELVVPGAVMRYAGYVIHHYHSGTELGRSYWAYYTSPAGDRWWTTNPVLRSADFRVTRIRARKLLLRKRERETRRDARIVDKAVAEAVERRLDSKDDDDPSAIA